MPHTPEHTTTGGNKNTSKLREAFRTGRKKLRGAANVAGKFTKAAIAEVSGGLREFGRGLTGREATPAGGGPGPAAEGPKATRAQQAAARLQARGGGVAGDAAGASGRPGIEVTQDKPPTRGPTSAAGKVGRVVRGAGKIAGPAGIGLSQAADIATSTIGSLPARFARLHPFTAPIAKAADTALRRARGESPLEAAVEPIVSGLSAATGGLVPEGLAPGAQESPLNITGPTASQTPLQIGQQIIGAQEDEEPAAPPGAGLRGAQFDETGARLFTNVDARAAAAGVDPASRRGTASLAENQAVAQRLGARGQAERAAGLRAAAQPGQPGQADPTATRLAQGGGLASAFGSLALSGNQLRREAAGRTQARTLQRDAQKQAAAAEIAGADRAVDIAQLQQTGRRDLANQLGAIQNNFAKASEAGTQEEFLDSTFRAATNNPTGAEGTFAGPIVGNEIRDLAGEGFLTSLNPATERGIFDWIASWGQGGQSQPLLTPEGQVTINAQTGSLEIVSPDGSTRQSLIDVDSLPERSQEYLRALGTQLSDQQLANQPGDPTLRGRPALTLRS